MIKLRSGVAALLACVMLSPASASAQSSSTPSAFDIAVASSVGLPCLDCAWQGVWCRICLRGQLTLNAGGSSSIPDSGLERLAASPWLQSASRCMADAGARKPEASVPDTLEQIAATQNNATLNMRHVQTCLDAELAPSNADTPRWSLYWDAEQSALSIENTRDDDESALVIVALHDVATDRSVEIPLNTDDAVVAVPGGNKKAILLDTLARFGPGTTLEIAVTSASKITRDRTELSVLSVDFGAK